MTERMGFFTDTTVCIGCKACEVACKQWNRLLAPSSGMSREYGHSYDNTLALDGFHWRHVKFIEQFNAERSEARWLMMSDTCKHCTQAPCIDACPEDAIIRTEFDTVVIDPELCKGYFAENLSQGQKPGSSSFTNREKPAPICMELIKIIWAALAIFIYSSIPRKCMLCRRRHNFNVHR